MYRSILVPLDGSAFSEHALPIALLLAQRSGATLRLIHVQTRSLADKDFTALSADHELSYLDQNKERLAANGGDGLAITTEVLDRSVLQLVQESLGKFLATHIAATAPDLVVMTTHGRGGLARAWLGSVADALIRQSNVPILLLRPHEGPPSFAPSPHLQQMLIPLDGSRLAEQILEPAFALGATLKTDFTLLRIVEPLFPIYNYLARTKELDEAEILAARRYLDEVGQRLTGAGRQVHTRVVLAAALAQAILDDAQHHPTDLIALATHGFSGLQRLMVGSVADKVLRGCEVPVLIYRPQEVASKKDFSE